MKQIISYDLIECNFELEDSTTFGIVYDIDYKKKQFKLKSGNIKDIYSYRPIALNRSVYYLDNNCGAEEHIVYANVIGMYVLDDNFDKYAQKQLSYNVYNYRTIPQHYEAVDSMSYFVNKEKVDIPFDYLPHLSELKDMLNYTIGIEYETALGTIPLDRCLRDGLIPLRDGSITSVEYSTIVMDKNCLPLIKQQLEDLNKYTVFDKNCALHMHFGGYPVEPVHLFLLSYVQGILEQREYTYLIPKFSFTTSRYKDNGKEYCRNTCVSKSFAGLFEHYTGFSFEGSLRQNHPRDPERRRKWEIPGRYYAMNLINMFCYQSPKTVEFRFLRPTYNYRKIVFWIAIFNAILLWCKKVIKSFAIPPKEEDIIEYLTLNEVSLKKIIESVYSKSCPNLTEELKDMLNLLQVVVNQQNNLKDYCGERTDIEDKILNQ